MAAGMQVMAQTDRTTDITTEISTYRLKNPYFDPGQDLLVSSEKHYWFFT